MQNIEEAVAFQTDEELQFKAKTNPIFIEPFSISIAQCQNYCQLFGLHLNAFCCSDNAVALIVWTVHEE